MIEWFRFTVRKKKKTRYVEVSSDVVPVDIEGGIKDSIHAFKGFRDGVKKVFPGLTPENLERMFNEKKS
jgi:hypothetical protein